MKPHELIRLIEGDTENLDRLCGEILATLRVNIERDALSSPLGEQAFSNFVELVCRWESTYARYTASVADYPNVTFRNFPAPADEREKTKLQDHGIDY